MEYFKEVPFTGSIIVLKYTMFNNTPVCFSFESSNKIINIK